jgi:Na+-translocating ferredoxin:NAD+ oxidoreductase RNF subunit RnfB
MSFSEWSPYLKIETACIACEWCKYNCPIEHCITFETEIATIHHEMCIECSRCVFVCPVDVIVPLREAQPRKKGSWREGC